MDFDFYPNWLYFVGKVSARQGKGDQKEAKGFMIRTVLMKTLAIFFFIIAGYTRTSSLLLSIIAVLAGFYSMYYYESCLANEILEDKCKAKNCRKY